MRISTSQTFAKGIEGLQNAAREIARTQEQISSGRKLLSPADDPVAAARILRLSQDSALRDQYRKNIDSVKSSLGLSEAALNQSVELLQRVQELTLQAGSGSNTRSDRQLIAVEIKQRLGELVAIANTRSASGEYLFGGAASSAPPFAATAAANYAYRGDQGQRELQIGASLKVATTDSGYDTFVDVPSAGPTVATRADSGNDPAGNAAISAGRVTDAAKFATFYPASAVITFEPLAGVTPPAVNYTVRRVADGRIVAGLQHVPYNGDAFIEFAGVAVQITGNAKPGDRFVVESTGKQPVLTTLARLEEGLRTIGDAAGDQADLQRLLAESLTNLEAGVGTIIATRSAIGARLNTADSTASLHDDVELLATRSLSGLRDVDFAEAASRLSQQSLVLQAAQQSFVKTASLSLFALI